MRGKWAITEENKQLSEEQAIEMAESSWWEGKSAEEIVKFQLYQEKLCMDFPDFHKAVEEALGRPVWTHEFALNYQGLKDEFEGKVGKPTMQDIIEMIPEEKRIIVMVDDSETESEES